MPRTPIFVLSLPRSGSTLLQRILTTHPQITSVAEPWILLPIFQALHRNGTVAEQGHQIQHDAICDFVSHLANGRETLNEAVRRFASTLYDQVNPDEDCRYFLDKTPRYSLICQELIDAFPNAKFIFLVRNPLAIAASTFTTWNTSYWNPAKHHADFYTGFARLTAAYERNRDAVLKLRYEDLVSEPEQQLAQLCDFLDIASKPVIEGDFSQVELPGKMGDPTGTAKYRQISDASVSSWQQHCRGLVRKSWLRNWLGWIGPHRLEMLGYDPVELMREVEELPAFSKNLARDAASWIIWRSALGVQTVAARGQFGSEIEAGHKPWIWKRSAG